MLAAAGLWEAANPVTRGNEALQITYLLLSPDFLLREICICSFFTLIVETEPVRVHSATDLCTLLLLKNTIKKWFFAQKRVSNTTGECILSYMKKRMLNSWDTCYDFRNAAVSTRLQTKSNTILLTLFKNNWDGKRVTVCNVNSRNKMFERYTCTCTYMCLHMNEQLLKQFHSPSPCRLSTGKWMENAKTLHSTWNFKL